MLSPKTPGGIGKNPLDWLGVWRGLGGDFTQLQILQELGTNIGRFSTVLWERSFVPENRPECKRRKSMRSLRIRILVGCSPRILQGLRCVRRRDECVLILM